jgi:hypothetical protein
MQTQTNLTIVPIKSLAEFKKAIQLDVAVHTIFHMQFNGRDSEQKPVYTTEDKGIRKVSVKQTNAFALKTTIAEGETVDSWCDYPKASECEVKDGKLLIYEEDQRENKRTLVLTYAILAA